MYLKLILILDSNLKRNKKIIVKLRHLRVTVGHPRVTIGDLRVTMGHPRLTIGYLKATVVHIRVT